MKLSAADSREEGMMAPVYSPKGRRPADAAAAAFIVGWLAFANSNWRGGSPARSRPSVRQTGRQPPAAATHCRLGFERV